MSKDKEKLFSKKNRTLLTDPLDDSNPITVQVLGVCSALAITVKLEPGVVMTLSVIFVRGPRERRRHLRHSRVECTTHAERHQPAAQPGSGDTPARRPGRADSGC